ncbi:dihydrolipoamide dehydrogenase [Paraoerskovia marina]|uniref:Dihydrolipoyl dehydrogenase n=1 Tax=Paraoerskovia marina TaxID=545619 RepID=A0A1H1S4M5_9CELL|nr:dihydrolipoyl dehydrogenase [Paraoerskovia marina]SDS42947.1 dihydrolipoamide dehydrogenase [Paraoerskovia marina]
MAESNTEFDLVVLGGGSAGYAAALRAAQLGSSVALIEARELGGTCLHRGCIPTKALLHAAEVADSARDAATVGVRATLDGVDMAAVHAYKDKTVDGLYRGLEGLVASRKVTLVEGWGTLTAPDTVEVDGVAYRGRAVLAAPGARSRTIPGVEIRDRVVTSDEALRLEEVPSSVVVLGGGVIGVEFASAWRSFGASVTIVEALDHLVPTEDVSSSKALERAFRRRGIDLRLGTRVAGVTQDDTAAHVTLEDGTTLDADVLLVAVGRAPATADLGLTEVGARLDDGFVVVDDTLSTGVGPLYAAGDAVRGPQLAHRGFAQGIFLAEHLAGLAPTPLDDAGIPRVTYSEPEVASVGLTEAQARARYGAEGVDTMEYNLAGNGRSKILGTQGHVKLIRAKDGPVVGVHLVGSRVGEQIGEGQLIVNWEAHPDEVAALVHAHPTQNEAMGEAHLALAGKPLHAHN